MSVAYSSGSSQHIRLLWLDPHEYVDQHIRAMQDARGWKETLKCFSGMNRKVCVLLLIGPAGLVRRVSTSSKWKCIYMINNVPFHYAKTRPHDPMQCDACSQNAIHLDLRQTHKYP